MSFREGCARQQAISNLYPVLAYGAGPKGEDGLVAIDITGHRRAPRILLCQMSQRGCFRSSSRSSLQSGSLGYVYGYHRHCSTGTSLRPGAGSFHSERSGGDVGPPMPRSHLGCYGLSRGVKTMRPRTQSLACRRVLKSAMGAKA